MIFSCTKKVQKILALTRRDLLVMSGDRTSDLAEWYCNLVFLDRRKCLIFTHAVTLYSFVVAGVRKADLAEFGQLFRACLSATLEADGFPRGAYGALVPGGPDVFASASKRGVIGSMADHANTCRVWVAQAGGLHRVNIQKLSLSLNEAPMSYIGMRHASEALKVMLGVKDA